MFVLNCRGAYNSFTVCAFVRFGRLGSPASEKVFALALFIYFADIWLSVGRKGAATVKTAGTTPPPRFRLAYHTSLMGRLCALRGPSSRSVPGAWEARGGDSAHWSRAAGRSRPLARVLRARPATSAPPREPGPVVRGRSWCACSDSVAAAAVGEGGLGLSLGGRLCAFPPLLCCHLRGP